MHSILRTRFEPPSHETMRGMLVSYVHTSNLDGWFVRPSREEQFARTSALVRRSSLILPVNVRRFVERAYTRGADAIVLDLEDSIPPSEKAVARTLVQESIGLAGKGGADVLVRINKPFELAVSDLDAAIWPGLAGIVFPKVESALEVHIIDRLLAERELARGLPVGGIDLSILVESALGVQHMAEIACASPRTVALSLGAEDFTRDIGVQPSADGEEQAYGKGMVVVAARLAGIQPHGLSSTLADYADLEGLARSVRRAQKLGFKGASCIHPTQVPILNQGFGPAPADVEYARRVIDVYAEAEAAGRASVALDGKMIDIPIVDRARTLLARAEAIAAREARARAALEAAS
jgi:citrate lyase subunit beta / citryl-CoA lyase